MRACVGLAAACAVALGAPAAADAIELRNGPLTATIEAEPFRIAFGGPGQPALVQAEGLELGYADAAGWHRGTRARELRLGGREGRGCRRDGRGRRRPRACAGGPRCDRGAGDAG